MQNKAIDKSKGKYLAFLDIDDTWYPKKIEKQINKMNLDTNYWSINGEKNFLKE